MSPNFLTIDDRASGDIRSSLGTAWRVIFDTVMGGVSQGQLTPSTVQGRLCLRLTGNVSLENNGGFIQTSLDLGTDALLDASSYLGCEIDVCGNGETYNLHLRTAATGIVWQSYRTSFVATPRWQVLHLLFAAFQAYRIDGPLICAVSNGSGWSRSAGSLRRSCVWGGWDCIVSRVRYVAREMRRA